MDEVDQAILTKLNATSGLSSLGVIYYGVQDEHAPVPYMAFSMLAGKNIEAIDQKFMYQSDYRFNIYHTDKNALATLQSVLTGTLSRQTLTYPAGFTHISCLQRGDDFIREHTRPTKNGELVYQSVSSFRILTDRSF